MANKNPSHKFEKGNNLGNKNGAPPGPRVRKSKMRSLEDDMLKLKTKAMENVGKVIEGKEEEVGKEQLTTSRWLLGQLVSVNKACVTEELAMHNIKMKNKEAAEELEESQAAEEEAPVKFSLVQLPTKSDL